MNVTQSTTIHSERYHDLHLSVDFERETAVLDGTRMKLTFKAFTLLAFLVRHPGQLIPRDTLLLLVWGYGADIRTRKAADSSTLLDFADYRRKPDFPARLVF